MGGPVAPVAEAFQDSIKVYKEKDVHAAIGGNLLSESEISGIAAKISSRLQLSLDVIDSYKNKPFNPALKKNDVAVVTSIVAKY